MWFASILNELWSIKLSTILDWKLYDDFTKLSFSQRFSTEFHTIFGDIKFMSDKVLKVWCRYLEPFSSYCQYPGGSNLHPNVARVKQAVASTSIVDAIIDINSSVIGSLADLVPEAGSVYGVACLRSCSDRAAVAGPDRLHPGRLCSGSSGLLQLGLQTASAAAAAPTISSDQ